MTCKHEDPQTQTVTDELVTEFDDKFAEVEHDHPEITPEIPRATNLDYALRPLAVGSRKTRWDDNPEIEVPIATDMNEILRPVGIGSKDVQWGPDIVPLATDLEDFLQPVGVGLKGLKWNTSIIPVSTHPAEVLRPVTVGTRNVKWEEHLLLLRNTNQVKFHMEDSPAPVDASCVVPAGLLSTGGCVHFRMIFHMAAQPRTFLLELVQGTQTVVIHQCVGGPNLDFIVLEGDVYELGGLPPRTAVLLQEEDHNVHLMLAPDVELFRVLENSTATIDPNLEFTIQLRMTATTTNVRAYLQVARYVYHPAVVAP